MINIPGMLLVAYVAEKMITDQEKALLYDKGLSFRNDVSQL
jgi:hypothetical protein